MSDCGDERVTVLRDVTGLTGLCLDGQADNCIMRRVVLAAAAVNVRVSRVPISGLFVFAAGLHAAETFGCSWYVVLPRASVVYSHHRCSVHSASTFR
jgi:hypothetical protein